MRVDEVTDVRLKTPDVGREDGEVVTITGLHDSTRRDGCREAVLGQDRSGVAVVVLAVRVVQSSCLAGAGQGLLDGERQELEGD